MKVFDRHEVIVLEFSGGRDSLACLHLLKPWWDRFTVVWLNTGDAFPETLRQMEEVEALVPHFTMVWSNQPKQIEKNGYPSDLTPFRYSPLGRFIYPDVGIKLQSSGACCSENRWFPMRDAVVALGATLVIRGSRSAECRKSPLKNGQVVDGIEYFHPIEDWSDEQVDEFLSSIGVDLPEIYKFSDTSLDCQHCTAWLDEHQGKFRYMEKHHPDLNNEVKERIRYIIRAAEAEMAHARAIVE